MHLIAEDGQAVAAEAAHVDPAKQELLWQVLRLTQILGLRSFIIAPLLARSRKLGLLTMVTSESGRHYDRHDPSLAEDLARRAAMAIDTARLYEQSVDAVHLREGFLEAASHELRTPLPNAQGYVQSLRRHVWRTVDYTEDEDAHEVHPCISHEGLGIPAEEQAQVFEPFFRGANVSPRSSHRAALRKRRGIGRRRVPTPGETPTRRTRP